MQGTCQIGRLGQQSDQDHQGDMSQPHMRAPGSLRRAPHLLPTFGRLSPSSSDSGQRLGKISVFGQRDRPARPPGQSNVVEANKAGPPRPFIRTLAFILGDGVLDEWCPQSCLQARRPTRQPGCPSALGFSGGSEGKELEAEANLQSPDLQGRWGESQCHPDLLPPQI